MTQESRVEALRREFDRTFTLAHRAPPADLEDFILLRAAGDPYAIRLGDIAALAARGTCVPLPSRRPEFLGLVGHLGSVVALFSLPQLLGYGAPPSLPRWFVPTRLRPSVALGFDEYEGHARIPRAEVSPLGEAARRRYVSQAVHLAAEARLLIELPAIVNGLMESDQ